MIVERLATTIRPQRLASRATASVVRHEAPAVVRAATVPVQTPGFKAKVLRAAHAFLNRHPKINKAIGFITEPMVKRKFNAPAAPGAGPVAAPLKTETIEKARAMMAERFKPEQGKVLIGISGGGKETVHAFVVSGVKPDGAVEITQAIAQYSDKPQAYEGVSGKITKLIDKKLGNQPNEMKGVVVEDWAEYAQRSKRNSIVLLELEATPAAAREALSEMKKMIGRPYDPTMLGSDPATAASEQAMYCTEITSWFVNKLKPGTIQASEVAGFPVFQVADHMRASNVHGGPLKVLYNGENRLDLKGLNPFPLQ